MVKRRKKNGLVKAVKDPIALGALSIGVNIAGQATQPLLPVGTTNPLTSIGTTSAQFVGPIGTIGLLGATVRQVRKIQPKKMKRRRR